MAQTMGSIVLYTYEKNWEDPWSLFKEKTKKTTWTNSRNDRGTERGQFIGITFISQWVQY